MNAETGILDSDKTAYKNLLYEINSLENGSRKLELDSFKRDEIINQTSKYINNFIGQLPSDKAYKLKELKKLKSLRIEEKGKPFDQLLDILQNEVDQAGINTASGGHLGYIPGGGIWTSAIADMLAAVTNRYAGISYSSPGAVIIENQLIQWLCSIVGYPATAHGNLTSGGSIA